MNYHRDHWKRWARTVGNVPEVDVALAAYDGVERLARPKMLYQRGGHPIQPQQPWQFPGPPAVEYRVEAAYRRIAATLIIAPQAPDADGRADAVEDLLYELHAAELDIVLGRLGNRGLDALGRLLLAAEHLERSWDFCRVQALFNLLLERPSPHVASLVGACISATQPGMDGLEDDDVDGWLGAGRAVRGARRPRVPDRRRLSGGGRGGCDGLAGRAAGPDRRLLVPDQPAGGGEGQPAVVAAPYQAESERYGQCVLLYDEDDRHPCPVTVTPDLPVSGGVLVGATGHTKDPAYAEMWPAYYEKAYAQQCAGYAAIEGGWARRAFPIITGREPVRLPTDSRDLPWRIDGHLRSGHAVAVGTRGGSDRDTVLGGRLVCGHEYFVKEVDTRAGRICLGNPWGDAASKTKWEVWLSLDEALTHLNEATAVLTR
ncbi:C2 family cysteine protease [Fodinicola feengrottensis]|uniref:C2 family cysteine protease n=1 Tax=Fodinicola feengrottensis TaxID=435914 RepID=UPI0013D322D1|nr:C2 family cysteine protease [Fodinicola feengrottensis]